MKRKRIGDMTVFSMLGTIVFISKIVMEFLPNIHPVAMFIAVFTLVYRSRALIPIYVYVILVGLYSGFNIWWVPYIYIWTVMWGLMMLVPKNASMRVKGVMSTLFCALHGILYGILYAPCQAIAFGLSFEGMISWIVAGFPFDVVHMLGNIAMSLLVIPLYKVIKMLENRRMTNTLAK